MKKSDPQSEESKKFETMSQLEEALRKSRGLSYLLSRSLSGVADFPNPPKEADLCGICDLSDALSDELEQRFAEVWQVAVKPQLVHEQSAA